MGPESSTKYNKMYFLSLFWHILALFGTYWHLLVLYGTFQKKNPLWQCLALFGPFCNKSHWLTTIIELRNAGNFWSPFQAFCLKNLGQRLSFFLNFTHFTGVAGDCLLPRYLFTESVHWTDLVQKWQCPSVCINLVPSREFFQRPRIAPRPQKAP